MVSLKPLPQVLSLSQTTVGQLTVGHVVNLASNDVRLLDDVRNFARVLV